MPTSSKLAQQRTSPKRMVERGSRRTIPVRAGKPYIVGDDFRGQFAAMRRLLDDATTGADGSPVPKGARPKKFFVGRATSENQSR